MSVSYVDTSVDSSTDRALDVLDTSHLPVQIMAPGRPTGQMTQELELLLSSNSLQSTNPRPPPPAPPQKHRF